MSGLSLAFVDDNEADHLLVQDAVEGLDVAIQCGHYLTAQRFLSALDGGEVTPHALITDLNMPGPSGFDLIRALRARAAWQHLPVMVLTTSPAEADRARAAALGVAGYFVKPFASSALVEQLQDMIRLVRSGASVSLTPGSERPGS